MSDYARTTLAFSVVHESVETVVTKLADYFERESDSPLVCDVAAPPTLQALFRPIADTPEKYHSPDWLEKDEPEPEDKTTLVKLAKKYNNLAVDTNFDFAGKLYQGSVFIYSVALPTDRSNSQYSFARFSFHSALTYALRGTREFGGRVIVDQEIKASLVKMAIGVGHTLGAKGLVYGLEGDGPLPFTEYQLGAYFRDPAIQKTPILPFFACIDKSIVSRSDLIRVWQDESAVKQTTSSFVLLDLLRDSEGWVEDESDL
jgi:hypothetical protein